MPSTWLVLCPPLIVLIVAYLTKNLSLSLITGLISGAIIAQHGNVVQAGYLLTHRFVQQIQNVDAWYLYGFLISMGALVVLFNKTGSATACARQLTSRLHSGKNVQTSSIILSLLLSLDDYLSCLTIGYVVRPLIDKFRIPRAKLAFLIHSMSGPLVIMVPISSWIGMLTGRIRQAGIGTAPGMTIVADPFLVYLKTLPYMLYSILIVASVVIIVRRALSFGPMHEQEVIAAQTGNLFGGKQPLVDETELERSERNGGIVDLVAPLVVLVLGILCGIPLAGGYTFGGSMSIMEAIGNNNQTFLVLLIAGIVSCAVGLAIAAWRRTNSVANIPHILYEGFVLMYPAMLMLFLASMLSEVLKDNLCIGQCLAASLQGVLSPALLPGIFFLIACCIAVVTGSSWGTIALLTPIGVPMLAALTSNAAETMAMLFPLLGGIFSGAVCGDHVSPISETTIMVSTSAGCYPVDHIITQFFYALPAIIGAAVGFSIVGFLVPYGAFVSIGATLLTAFFVSILLLYAADRFFKVHKNT